MLEDKGAIRSRLKELRERLSPDEVEAKSRIIQQKIVESPFFKQAQSIALYAAIRNEVQTDHIFKEASGKRVVYPQAQSDQFDLSSVDLVIVPGIAFDEKGYRIGFGGGFYDRALEGYKGLTVGLAYDFQVLKEIPHTPKDVPCHKIFTERRVIDFKK